MRKINQTGEFFLKRMGPSRARVNLCLQRKMVVNNRIGQFKTSRLVSHNFIELKRLLGVHTGRVHQQTVEKCRRPTGGRRRLGRLRIGVVGRPSVEPDADADRRHAPAL